MKVEIITPDKKLFEGEVKSLVLPGADGSIGILNNHAPLITSLKGGIVKITDYSQQIQTFEIKGGVAEVQRGNEVIVLAE